MMGGEFLTRSHAWLKNKIPAELAQWDKVTDEDLEELQCLLDGLVSLKYKPDSNGNNPISFVIIDHTKVNNDDEL